MHSRITTYTYTCIIFTLFVSKVSAADYKIEPYVGAQQVYSDNIFLDDANKEDDFVTYLRGGLYSTYDGRRIKSRFNYALDQFLYANVGDDDTIHNLRADARAELYQDHLFLDFNALNGKQIVNANASVAEDNISASNNREDVFYYSANPYWKQKIYNWANVTMGHVYDEILSDIGDSNSNQSYINIVNGTDVTRLLFNFEANNRFVDIENGDDARFTTIRNRFIYPVTRTFSATASVGYDDDDFTSNSRTSGMLWNVGFIWRPSRNTNLDLSVGERYFGTDVRVRADYDLGKTTFRMTFDRYQQTTRDNIFTDQSEALYAVGRSGLVDEDGNLIDDRNFGSATALDGVALNQTGETIISSELRAVVRYQHLRNLFEFVTFYDQDEFQITSGELDTIGTEFTWQRELSRTLTSELKLIYENRDVDQFVESDDFLASLQLNKQLSETFSVYFTYRYASFDPTSVNSIINAATENRVLIGINKRF